MMNTPNRKYPYRPRAKGRRLWEGDVPPVRISLLLPISLAERIEAVAGEHGNWSDLIRRYIDKGLQSEPKETTK